MNEKSDGPPKRGSLGLVVVAVLLLLGGLWGFLDRGQKFDSTAWKSARMDKDDRSVRYEMLDDLLRNHHLIGRTREEVVGLLGQPGSECWSDAYPYPGWSVGITPGATDTSGFMCEFDASGRIRRVYGPGIGIEGWGGRK
jgi:hypothetical protein